MAPSLHTARLGCALAKDTQREVSHLAEDHTEGIMMTQEQLDKIHELQRVALDNGDRATYWALAVAIDFGLGKSSAVAEDIARVQSDQGRKP